jgi:hypothetical protein
MQLLKLLTAISWIGTDKGLVRFDGLNFRLIQPSSSALFPGGPVLELATDGNEDLWVRLRGGGLLRYQGIGGCPVCGSAPKGSERNLKFGVV